MSDIWTFAGENKEGCSTEFRLTRNSGEEASMILAQDSADNDHGSTLEGSTLTIDPSEINPTLITKFTLSYTTPNKDFNQDIILTVNPVDLGCPEGDPAMVYKPDVTQLVIDADKTGDKIVKLPTDGFQKDSSLEMPFGYPCYNWINANMFLAYTNSGGTALSVDD